MKQFLCSLTNPKTAMGTIGMFWLLTIINILFLIVVGLFGGRLQAVLAESVDCVIGMGIITVVAVLILSIKKLKKWLFQEIH